uniref:Carbohydrate-binding domain-containing protein n=1 Tax=Peronospora matthiolae TaxID=2874970 RepID=A0AAV1TUW9_9STRA
MASGEDWTYMDTLRPPVYICLRRKIDCSDAGYRPMKLDGDVDKDEWRHVPWSEAFVDIEGRERKPVEHPLTRFKMMYDDEMLYIAAELLEPKVWGTITEKNSTLYHENDFEVFFNPDGSRHHYYEVEVNCLNTVWELLLHRPYKDGHSIENPFNLKSLRSAVHVDGVANSPETDCSRWCVEMSWSLAELEQFDKLRFHGEVLPKAPSIATVGDLRPAATTNCTVAGNVWRVNFSRVQYELETAVDPDTQQVQYQKVRDKREDNIVWAPTGVIDIHRPERWGYVLFSSEEELADGELELAGAMATYLEEQIAIERVLDAIYYKQRAFHAIYGGFASTMERLYTKPALRTSLDSSALPDDNVNEWTDAFPLSELLHQYQLDTPVISFDGDLDTDGRCPAACDQPDDTFNTPQDCSTAAGHHDATTISSQCSRLQTGTSLSGR